MKNRGAAIQDQLICTDPSNVDLDGDGFSGCDVDCDDDDPKVNPGVEEDCDLDDDNCNDLWDDDPKCPQCVEHDLPAPQAGSAALCFTDRSFADAEADCVAQGGHLLSIHDVELQTFAATHALEIRDTEWWFGLNDIEAEDTFVWTDGTALDYTHWADGEPDNDGDEDCVYLGPWGDGQWIDLYCEVERPYICRLP